MRLLFIDACPRADSRTRRLAESRIGDFRGEIVRIFLDGEGLTPLSGAELERREALIAAGDYSSPCFRYAKEFASADEIVVCAPYWDLSFPSVLKVFLERVCVRGVTFSFTETGEAVGLCRARRMRYFTTMGAEGLPYDFGYGYVSALCRTYFGIADTELISAEGLDLEGRDPEEILKAVAEGPRE